MAPAVVSGYSLFTKAAVELAVRDPEIAAAALHAYRRPEDSAPPASAGRRRPARSTTASTPARSPPTTSPSLAAWRFLGGDGVGRTAFNLLIRGE
ncbi:hypothetical protein [Mangrovihabitans endophyticus]|uniref:Uncharacterized protein n=1 Tax=Mangrovihabitans endophyticus TaxID=1751298 RepID=A0A8J3C3P3_9ACTN|nr:hypothetical protein [Mangrovihabitans endophyticus]GGL13143.1 hypothetical protein GCM10012284_54760 [Mangrovihabitans endophyticus]